MNATKKYRAKLRRKDKTASFIISIGGYAVIVSIVLMFLFLLYKVIPLAVGSSAEELFSFNVAGNKSAFLIAGSDEYNDTAYLIDRSGKIIFYDLVNQKPKSEESISLFQDEKIISLAKLPDDNIVAVGTNAGRIITTEINMRPVYSREGRVIKTSVYESDTFIAEKDSNSFNHIERLVFARNEDGVFFWVWVNHFNELKLRIFDQDEDEIYQYNLTDQFGDINISGLAISGSGESIIAGDTSGELFWFDASDFENPNLNNHWKASDAEITSIEFLIGGNSLTVGDKIGGVKVWLPQRNNEGSFNFIEAHSFERGNSAIKQIIASPRKRLFIALDDSNNISLNYSTTGNTEAEYFLGETRVSLIAFSPKADRIILINSENNLTELEIDSEHPEVSLKTLFGKVLYEGYQEPEFIWQSTGGSDSFEPKLSLIPLIFGTLKGTFYAMLFSIPLALMGAIYVSQFAPFRFAKIVKPSIEIMAALPSVVIGFLAGLYFAPLFEENLMQIMLTIFIMPLLLIAGVSFYSVIPESQRRTFSTAAEILFIVILMSFAFYAVSLLADPVEDLIFSGDFRQWLYDALAITFDQRNSVVVGFALGFAVIPIIFTISEDAISNVPESLFSASLALGATRWQTMIRVVLPAAAGGIFAAVMLGLGRAIGETMIVLMATGNTPILDLNPFNGFRTMSACIAVEIPEAPVDGTLYRVLFLTAFLLFIFTFLINSMASYVGDKLRKKYARF